ncbi:hypothetical protein ACFLZW_01570 [Chloroflexota bacterium]
MSKNLNSKTVVLSSLEIKASEAEMTTWHGREALRLENGLALAPDGLLFQDICLEVSISVEGPAYPGLIFRLADPDSYELAYAVPHASEQWDAIQYDPIFLGSNTWQVYFGAAYQTAAKVPSGDWFRLRVQASGQRAAIFVNEQAPLVVEKLAHPAQPGRFGLWTFRPAYFCDLSVSTRSEMNIPSGVFPSSPPGALDGWWLQGFGLVNCEPHGVLNLNRYLNTEQSPAMLTRQFDLEADGQVSFQIGFSDSLNLLLDGQELFCGERRFSGFANRTERGYADSGDFQIQKYLSAGRHTLTAQVDVQEPFGWGLALVVHAAGLRWLPPAIVPNAAVL